MSTPSARYIITADDKTKAALASVRSGFNAMERGVKGTVTRLNAALGLIAGMGIKKVFQSVFSETAKGSREFSAALDDVKQSARSLLAAKDGAPAAAAAMRELAEILKDPEFQEAADKISSALIGGFANTIKFVTGIKTLREEIEELKRLKEDLERDAGGAFRGGFIKGEPGLGTSGDQAANRSQSIEAINAAIRAREARLGDEQRMRIGRGMAIDAAANRASERFNTMREFEENIRVFEDVEKRLEDGPAGDAEFFDGLIRSAEIAEFKVRNAFFDEMDRAARDTSDTIDRTGDSIDQVATEMEHKWEAATNSLSVFADEAARSMQAHFAEFLFDPFQDGLDGMLKGFVDVIRRMLSEAAAAMIFETLFGKKGSSSGGGLAGGILPGEWDWLGKIFGFFGGGKAAGGPLQQGKWYIAGEKGPEPIWGGGPGAFAVGYPQMAAATHVTVHMPVDMRGSTVDAVRLFQAEQPRLIRQAADLAKAELREDRRRGRF